MVSSTAAVVENEEQESNHASQDNKSSMENQTEATSALVSNEEIKENEVVPTSNSKLSFTELKNERDIMYSRSLEMYQKIIDNQSIGAEQKSIAIQEIDKISQMQNAIQIAEELIKLKDFEDVVIYSVNDKVSVIVRVSALSEPQVAQIQNIVSTQLGVKISDISISNK